MALNNSKLWQSYDKEKTILFRPDKLFWRGNEAENDILILINATQELQRARKTDSTLAKGMRIIGTVSAAMCPRE